MAKRKTHDRILTEAAQQLAEAAVGAFGVGTRDFGFNDIDGSKVRVTVAIEGKQRYEVQTITDKTTTSGVHYRISDMKGDNRVATCYDVDHAIIVTHALNAMEKRAQAAGVRRKK
jgi:hypothetical protein